MSEPNAALPDSIAAAVGAATSATVAPPFDVVERRAIVRFRRQVTTAALAIVAVLAGGALAIPRLDDRETTPTGGTHKTWEDLTRNPEDARKFMQCRFDHATPGPPESPEATTVSPQTSVDCLRALGYEPPRALSDLVDGLLASPATGAPRPVGTGPCRGDMSPGTPGTETVRAGAAGPMEWVLVVRKPAGSAAEPCVALVTGQAPGGSHGASGPAGGGLSSEAWRIGQETYLIVYGAVPRDTDRVEITVEGKRYVITDPVASTLTPRWSYVARTISVHELIQDEMTVVAYDAQGRVLAR